MVRYLFHLADDKMFAFFTFILLFIYQLTQYIIYYMLIIH